MNLHEYQGKLLFAEYNLPVSKDKFSKPLISVSSASENHFLNNS